ncbi:MAG TPA: MaoC family dehydratase [Smithellaceae bacterium]|nr:MaoC family dehydratase [Smithellaceae bacterium]
MKMLYFDDFKVGDRFTSPGATITESQIIDFAMHYDSQPFHMDAEAAKKSIFGGLIASGIHTFAVTFRLILMTGVITGSNLGSPGMDELRWLQPVRPGDTLRAVLEVLETIPSKSKPDRGIVRFRYTTVNQRDEEVLTVVAKQIIAKKQQTA